ncbi:DUF2891 domain-containing protein [Novosphingobium sp. 1949]|uniref:DUF2891 domain-containing protein n=1 Tax=Novosphingobium organovorum TaxID=2930092 RepID=A0ABT0BF29_9SPHN|nr:DUF2891 domain-containing protein [Novosphingobium organovorum]MCJ2183664.1 DUF2891 domain-containing protein [Novosphingobium organovorum]
MTQLSPEVAARFARIALGHVTREYPHKLDHVMDDDGDVLPPRALHPVFFGSFDWHSCVHGWWTLLTLRRLFPTMEEAKAIDALAHTTFTAEKLGRELAYLKRPSARGFERPYGWGWLLYLHLEATRHADSPLAAALDPLARAFARRFGDYLDKLTYPITVGTHFNTAFALTLAHEWATVHEAPLAARIESWAQDAFGARTDYRGWEPGGDEFLSPALSAARLMHAALPAERFARWFDAFLPEGGWLDTALTPAFVSDRSDGKIAHLDGLNLSRAWCLRAVARSLPQARAAQLENLAQTHLAAALDHVAGDYMGEHWLASFALLVFLEG